ncbi:hypothetical protein CYLTODRAFT_61688 [Cylindrobasidium torrendii FP15055 ss-10]|uniref:Uncharacterized protein n=1 Tax=Cylindrobasidium torrendii FP15055 ss-10 TaxID=1314674 RepID=A0A0D7B7F4_9AGAR|nr:hypothetical protein CYLTODRAFT_61688 [Cylindrobasidium torrendii FP15055 ss-10]
MQRNLRSECVLKCLAADFIPVTSKAVVYLLENCGQSVPNITTSRESIVAFLSSALPRYSLDGQAAEIESVPPDCEPLLRYIAAYMDTSGAGFSCNPVVSALDVQRATYLALGPAADEIDYFETPPFRDWAQEELDIRLSALNKIVEGAASIESSAIVRASTFLQAAHQRHLGVSYEAVEMDVDSEGDTSPEADAVVKSEAQEVILEGSDTPKVCQWSDCVHQRSSLSTEVGLSPHPIQPSFFDCILSTAPCHQREFRHELCKAGIGDVECVREHSWN